MNEIKTWPCTTARIKTDMKSLGESVSWLAPSSTGWYVKDWHDGMSIYLVLSVEASDVHSLRPRGSRKCTPNTNTCMWAPKTCTGTAAALFKTAPTGSSLPTPRQPPAPHGTCAFWSGLAVVHQATPCEQNCHSMAQRSAGHRLSKEASPFLQLWIWSSGRGHPDGGVGGYPKVAWGGFWGSGDIPFLDLEDVYVYVYLWWFSELHIYDMCIVFSEIVKNPNP